MINVNENGYSEVMDEVITFVEELNFEDTKRLIMNYIPEQDRIIKSGYDDSEFIYNANNPPDNFKKSTSNLITDYPKLNLIKFRMEEHARYENGGPLDYKMMAFLILPEAFVEIIQAEITVDNEEENSFDDRFKVDLEIKISELSNENLNEAVETTDVPEEDESPAFDETEIEYLHALNVLKRLGEDPRGIIIEYVNNLDVN